MAEVRSSTVDCPKHGTQPTILVPRSDILRAADKRECAACYLARLARRAR